MDTAGLPLGKPLAGPRSRGMPNPQFPGRKSRTSREFPLALTVDILVIVFCPSVRMKDIHLLWWVTSSISADAVPLMAMMTAIKNNRILFFITHSPLCSSASSTAADHGASSHGAAPWLKAACSPGRLFPRHTAVRCGQPHSLPASVQAPAAAGRPAPWRVTSLGDHRPPRAGQDISGAGRKTGASWRQATTRQGAGAMGWAGMDGEKREGGRRRDVPVGT